MTAPVYHHNSSRNPQSSELINNEASIQERLTHNPPKNLSPIEVQCLYDLLGKDSVTLATSVAQILHSDNNNWRKQVCGVLCFVKDYSKRIYCFRVYDLQFKQAIYEEIVHSSLRLEKIANVLYTFNGMNCKVGINFIDQMEAEIFCNDFHAKQNSRQKKKQSKEPTNKQQRPMPLTKSEIITISTNEPLPNPDEASKKQSASKTQHKKFKDNRPTISLPIPSSFTHIIHAGSNDSFVTDEAHKKLFEEVLSNMPITTEEKLYVRSTVTDTDGALEKLFTESLPDYGNQRHEMSDCPPKIPPRTYLTIGRNNIQRGPHQDISIPSLITKKTNIICTQNPNMSNTSTILEPAKPPIVPPKPHTNISNNTHAPIPIPPPLPPPRNASLENQNPFSNIPPPLPPPRNASLENQNPFSNIPPPLPPPLPIFSSEQMTNKPSTPSPKFQHNGFLQEILDYNKSKLKSEAERSTTLKTSSTNKSNGEVQRTLEANILEMIAQRRPGIMGRDNDNDDENDLNEDEWDE